MKTIIAILSLCFLISCPAFAQEMKEEMPFYKFVVKDINGKDFAFEQLKGKKILIVNVASKCGLTPQYEELQALYKKYSGNGKEWKEKDFVIIGFPANDFGKQEPGTNDEIKTFCTTNYGVTFPMMSKITVKGDEIHPVYQWLTQKELNGVKDAPVEWNFQKFLIDEQGNFVDMIPPKEQPDSEKIIQWLEEKPLFNGKDLSGWSVMCQSQDSEKEFWTVEDGAILCDSIGKKDHTYVWLMTDREFQDFELRLKFQAYSDSPGNSGLQFRSRYDKTDNGGWLNGPQVDIHPPQAMSWRTGLLYDETRGENRWIFPSLKNSNMPDSFKPEKSVMKYAGDGDGWNDLTLICKGMQIKTIVNGIIRTDWDATGVLDSELHKKHNVGQKGHIALQLHHGDELRIKFKDIRIREIKE